MKEGIELVAHCPDGVHPLDFSCALTKKIRWEGWAVGVPVPRNISAGAARRMSKTQMENLIRAELASGKVKRLFLYPGEEAASKTAEDIFLYALCTHEGEWTKSQIDTLQKYSRDKRFRERLARAMENGKPPPLFDRVDIAILFNWRTFRFKAGNNKIMPAGLPGLHDWSPYAAGQLFTRARLFSYNDDSDSASAESRYKKRCQRLGLPSKRRYLIRDFFVIGNEVKVIRAG